MVPHLHKRLGHRHVRWCGLFVAAMTMAVVGCAGSDGGPQLVAVEATPTVAATPTPISTPTPVAATPTTAPTAEPAATPEPVPALRRGVSETAVRIGVIKSGLVFGDPELGVRARIQRLNAEGGVGGRQLDLVSVVDDEGDPDRAAELARELVETDEVFAVVVASIAPGTTLTDYLAEQSVPFVGWGFSAGFCEPNQWGFGFNGCLVGGALGIEDAAVDTTGRDLITAYLDREPTVVLVVPPAPAGDVADTLAAEVWGDGLLDSVTFDPDAAEPFVPIGEAITAHDPDVLLLATGLEASIAIKGRFVGSFDGIVVDEVGYLPGLLGDFSVADQMEGGFSVTQFPPQEEYREATGVVATDLQRAGSDLIYSQAVSIGYWSTDLLGVLIDAVGPDLDTATFFTAANDVGLDYAPTLVGAPCPLNTLRIHRDPAGGGALVVVQGGIYRPAVEFTCPADE